MAGGRALLQKGQVVTDQATGKIQGGDRLAQHTAATLPEGITAIETVHYRVGAYTYTNLDDAMAQHRRDLAAKIDTDRSIV